MSFQFRFESILQLRRRQRDERGADVGQAIEALRRIEQQMQDLDQERQRVMHESAVQRTGQISIDRLLAGGRYEMQLQADLQALRETRDTLNQELEKRQQALTQAQLEVKRYERLRENDLAEFEAQQQRRQQAEIDEIASRRVAQQTNTRG